MFKYPPMVTPHPYKNTLPFHRLFSLSPISPSIKNKTSPAVVFHPSLHPSLSVFLCHILLCSSLLCCWLVQEASFFIGLFCLHLHHNVIIHIPTCHFLLVLLAAGQLALLVEEVEECHQQQQH